MPASGFVKLRTKSVTLADNDVLTFAGGATITINSATGGQAGWLHFVGEEGTSSGNGRALAPTLGKITTRGDMFLLGTGSGSSGQTLQYYVSEFCPAIQVETASGSGVYEWWGLCPSADFSATNIATDDRGRFFTCSAAGVITFGGATFGKLPPSGARIRCPNIHVSSSTSTNWNANTLNATTFNRYSFQSTGGIVDLEYTAFSGSFGAIGSSLLSAKFCTGIDTAFNEGQPTTGVSSNNKEVYYIQESKVILQ
jgi:hypothetical protein